ncbi:MAG: hypothetical protein FD123_1552 [Bacteroidetes bacterium]|nr:MAG: hypothetical protein FD123_1552 [Bacteroidota bacterium]
MKLLQSVFLFLLAASPALAQTEPTDEGLSSEVHKAYAGKVAFSSSKIEFQKENTADFKTHFNYGDPIYGRVYFAKGLNREYFAMGWDFSGDTWYSFEIKLNGEKIGPFSSKFDKTWTTFLETISPTAAEVSAGTKKGYIQAMAGLLKQGENTVELVYYVQQSEKGKRGKEICRSNFLLDVSAAQFAKLSPSPKFTNLKTMWSGTDAWKEWTVTVNDQRGSLKTVWSGADAWKEWKYSVSGSSGTIKTMSGADAWKEWRITDGSKTYTVKTMWSGDDAWKEWRCTDGGSFNIKTMWSGDDAWKEWRITDDISAPAEVKMALVFAAAIAGHTIPRG